MNDFREPGRQVPSGRLARFGQFGRLAGGIAGGMIAGGARRLADGERPRLRDEWVQIAADKASWHVPPADILFVQRKVSGTALLAARLKARVDVRAMVETWVNAS